MAGNIAGGTGGRLENGTVNLAAGPRMGAARMERASWRRIERRGEFAFEDDALALDAGDAGRLEQDADAELGNAEAAAGGEGANLVDRLQMPDKAD